MHLTNHSLAGPSATTLPPTTPPSSVLSLSPIVLHAPGRRDSNLQLRVTLPSAQQNQQNPRPLPILLLSHGHGPSYHLSSLEGYAPLAEFYAAHGFAVLQPTHLSSRHLGLEAPANNTTLLRELWLDSRPRDMSTLLDRLDELESDASVALLLAGRSFDRDRVAVVGHSLGGLTAALLLGAANTDPTDGSRTELRDGRIKAGVLFGAPGTAGDDLSDSGRRMLPFYEIDFGTMRAPALVVWGDEDVGPHLTVRGADWHQDPYTLAPGPKDALMVKGGKHGFGGISGWDAAECKDESPERLAAMQRLSWAYLWSQLYQGEKVWEEAREKLEGLEGIGKVERK